VLLGCGLRRFEAAARAMGRAERRVGRWGSAEWPMPSAGGVSRAAYYSLTSNAGRLGAIIAARGGRPAADDGPGLAQRLPATRVPIRPPAVAAADNGRRATELTAAIRLCAPAMFLGCGRRRSAPRRARWATANGGHAGGASRKGRGCWREAAGSTARASHAGQLQAALV